MVDNALLARRFGLKEFDFMVRPLLRKMVADVFAKGLSIEDHRTIWFALGY
jgi:hypothetical protein